MKLKESFRVLDILTAIQGEPLTDQVETSLTGCYLADLLSDVLAHAEPGMLWVTIQTHRNVVSVAAMKDIAAVVITCGRRPGPDVIAEAAREGITLVVTPLTTYETAAKLWELGIR